MKGTYQNIASQITSQQNQHIITTSNQYDDSYLFNSLKTDEYYYKIKELNLMYLSLGYKNDVILEIGKEIITCCFSTNKLDIKVSKTGENELLIYRKNDGSFNHIVIDECGDIEFVHIPDDWRESYNEHYQFIYLNCVPELVSKL